MNKVPMFVLNSLTAIFHLPSVGCNYTMHFKGFVEFLGYAVFYDGSFEPPSEDDVAACKATRQQFFEEQVRYVPSQRVYNFLFIYPVYCSSNTIVVVLIV